MTKAYSKIFKFLVVFTVVTIIPLIIYLTSRNTHTKNYLTKFSQENIKKTCADSPVGKTFLQCFRGSLGKILPSSTSIDFISVINTEERIFNLDIFYVSDKQSKLIILINHLENWSIIADYIKHYRFISDDVSFFQIITIPIIKTILVHHIEKIKTLAGTTPNKLKELRKPLSSVQKERLIRSSSKILKINLSWY